MVEVLAEAIPSPRGTVFTIAIGPPHEVMNHNCRSFLHGESIRREAPVLAEWTGPYELWADFVFPPSAAEGLNGRPHVYLAAQCDPCFRGVPIAEGRQDTQDMRQAWG